MSGTATHPRTSQTAITLVLGFGQTIAFASSFYLLGVLGDAIAADLRFSPTVIFSLMSVALAVTPLVATRTARWIEARGGKEVLLASNVIFGAGLILLALATNGLTLAFARGQRIEDFDNVSVAPLLRTLLGLPADPTLDGTDAPFRPVLTQR